MLSKLTESLFNAFMNELKNKERMGKLESEWIDPMLYYIFKKSIPYIVMIVLFLVFIVVICTILTLWILKKTSVWIHPMSPQSPSILMV